MIYVTVQEPQGQLLQPNRKEREEKLQGQESPAVYQVPAATHHSQVNREGNEGDVVEGSGARQESGAQHDFTQARAQQPAALLPPVDGHGPQAQVDQVAAGASDNEYRHVAPYLVPPAKQTSHHRDEDGNIQAEAWEEKQNFRGGTKVQVDRDRAQDGRCVIHGKQVVKATMSAVVSYKGGLTFLCCRKYY